MTKRTPSPIDLIIGQNLRRIREELRVSRRILAEPIGISHQQIEKCERGINRIPASHLYLYSHLLNRSIHDFFDGITFEILNETCSERLSQLQPLSEK